MSESTVRFLAAARKRYLRYAKHVLGFRHFSEGRDGLKPVQRRAVWSAYKIGATSRAKPEKTAAISGYAFGHYHPHAEESVSGAIANMSQATTLAPMFLGVGNFGSHDAPPASPRYTSAFLSPYAVTMLDPDELAVVPMDASYDGKNTEPRYLPARIPHLLLAGCTSLAPGYNGNVPACHPDWVLETLEATRAGKRPKLPKLMANRWGGRLVSIDGDWLTTGVATLTYAPECHSEGPQLVFTSLAPSLSLLALERRLEKFPGFAGIAKETPAPGNAVRLVARVKRGHSVEELKKFVDDHCASRDHLSMLHIRQRSDEDGDVTYDPIVGGPVDFLKGWLSWREKLISAAARRRAALLREESSRHLLLARAAELRRQVLAILNEANSREDIRARTARLMKCTTEEADVVMALSWPRLARLEVAPLKEASADCLRRAREQDRVASEPGKHVMGAAEAAVAALKDTLRDAEQMRAGSPRGKRGRS